MTIPPHEHHVRLGLTHSELDAQYGLGEKVQLSIQLPYDVKAMRVRYSTLDGAPFTPPYGDIHHRTETLRGISDPSLLLDYAPHDRWLLGFGTTIPIGHLEPDPVELGREGKTHEHIQFGSGTFEPRLSAQYSAAHWVARAEARLSLYENRYGFRAPSTYSWSIGPNFRAGRLSIAPRITGQYQTIGRWSGAIDEGSGFQNGGARLQIALPVGSLTLAPSVYRELWSHGFSGESFRQGTTWSLAVSKVFR